MTKIALITGASSGIGKEMVKALDTTQLDEIWIVARRAQQLSEVAGQIDIPVRQFAIDLTTDVEALATALDETKPSIQWLINAAGYGPMGAIGDLPLGVEKGMIRLNCEALVAVTHISLPYMTRGSHIIQVASIAGLVPQYNWGVYAATKAFVHSYSRTLHAELAPKGITVTALCPSPTETEFFDVAAQHETLPFFENLKRLDAETVATQALRDAKRGKAESLPGVMAKSFKIVSKLLPIGLVLFVMRALIKKEAKKNNLQ